MTELSEDDVRTALRHYCYAAGTQRAAAKQLGVSAAYLSEVLMGHVPMSLYLAQCLGFDRRVTWLKRDEDLVSGGEAPR